MYVREKVSLGGNEPRTSQVNIREGKQLNGLYRLPLRTASLMHRHSESGVVIKAEHCLLGLMG